MNITLSTPNSHKYIITRVTPDREIETLDGVISYNDETKVMVRQRFDPHLNQVVTYEETTDGCMVHTLRENPCGPSIADHEDARCMHIVELAIEAHKTRQP